MSAAIALFRKILKDKEPLTAISEYGLGRSDFVNDEQKVYDVIHAYYKRFGKLPEIRTVEVESEIDLPKAPNEPLEYWLGVVAHRSKQKLILGAIDDASRAMEDGDTQKALNSFQGALFSIERKFKTEGAYLVSDLMELAYEHHIKRKLSADIMGISFGLDYLDRISDGAQPGDTIALVGRPGTGKTYLALYFAVASFDQGKRVMLLSPEMGLR